MCFSWTWPCATQAGSSPSPSPSTTPPSGRTSGTYRSSVSLRRSPSTSTYMEASSSLLSSVLIATLGHPISSLRWWDVSKAKLCTMCTWVVLLLSSIPDVVVIFANQKPENINMCMEHIHGSLIYVKAITIFRTIAGFLLPFSVMLTCYLMTVRVLSHLPRGRRHRGGQRAGGKPLLLITAAILVFVVSFVPYHVMAITLVFMRINDQSTQSNNTILCASCYFFEAMCSISSCLNLVLYIMASEQFQRRLLALRRDGYRSLCCRASRRVGVHWAMSGLCGPAVSNGFDWIISTHVYRGQMPML